MNRLYAAYGYTVRSEIPLPELAGLSAAAGRSPDIHIRAGEVAPRPRRAAHWGGHAELTADEARLSWDHVGAFHVRAGREIVVDVLEGAAPQQVRLFLLGSVMSVLLWQRGRLVLHASAAAVGRGAVAILGECGAGKSTLAAALRARGHVFLADDVLALEVSGEGGGRAGGREPAAYPGFPNLKLWPDSLRALGEAPDRWPQIHPEREKRALRLPNGFALEPLPLSRVIVLAEGGRAALAPLREREAFAELVRHSFAVRLHRSVAQERHFHQCAELASAVPCVRLETPRALDRVDELARLVEESLLLPAQSS